jgi:hypothetical protein
VSSQQHAEVKEAELVAVETVEVFPYFSRYAEWFNLLGTASTSSTLCSSVVHDMGRERRQTSSPKQGQEFKHLLQPMRWTELLTPPLRAMSA